MFQLFKNQLQAEFMSRIQVAGLNKTTKSPSITCGPAENRNKC